MLDEISAIQDSIFKNSLMHGEEIIKLRKEQNQLNKRLDYFIQEVNDILDDTGPGFIRNEQKKTEH